MALPPIAARGRVEVDLRDSCNCSCCPVGRFSKSPVGSPSTLKKVRAIIDNKRDIGSLALPLPAPTGPVTATQTPASSADVISG